jgi:hypothetical protein
MYRKERRGGGVDLQWKWFSTATPTKQQTKEKKKKGKKRIKSR